MPFQTLRHFKNWIVGIFNPPYQLSLCEILPGRQGGGTVYVFKQYGTHDIVKLSHKDIIGNVQILAAINPKDLIGIALYENNLKEAAGECQVLETIRGNQYRIASHGREEVYSGESICGNLDLFQRLPPHEICKIAYETGFSKGRKVSGQLRALAEQGRAEAGAAAANVVPLRSRQ
ncbi:hypothetical protein KIF53_14360 [Chromobacterium subtsugae]|uniref:Uncharacterized protein n=1 Tax=Chromobacterium subtsugae TaxID=251747 RepID=A0ABS7FFG5_9NEIS|nr:MULTISPECIES: hypothetical protein [Chromobacterium]KUM01998.1 hypothetical protein Cv017_05320 [Chromobacterium subtsugae]KZE85476.1 hypothetical protein AWB61_19730 [Chromobacterium sp. F49]MBW7567556.1 hypothetical protein [Chromobacterium subtsugae]MBW8288816.1 hypothetical protein [Chromobacterium subtsugae]OBU87052.1 hypothetical protein MY55_05955 [Chromobacterium subtsugae]